VLKVYFAAPMLGDRSNLEDNRKIASALKAMGCEILTEWVLEEVLDIERGATPKEIFERDIEILMAVYQFDMNKISKEMNTNILCNFRIDQ